MGLHPFPDFHTLHGHTFLSPHLTGFVLMSKAGVPEAMIMPMVSQLMLILRPLWVPPSTLAISL